MVPAVLRRTLAEMERRTPIIARSMCTARSRPPTWPTAMRARRAGPAYAWRRSIGALNLAAGLRDAWLAHSPVIAVHRRPRSADEVPQGLSGSRRRAGVRAGDQVERHRRRGRAHPRHAAAGVSRRGHRHARSGASAVSRQRGPDRPGRGRPGPALSSRASRACRRSVPSPMPRACGGAELLQGAERPVIVAGGGVRASGAAAELVALADKLQIPVATSLNGKDFHPRRASAVGRRGRHLFARERQPRGRRGRSRLLRRHRDGRHDHALLEGAEGRRRRRSRSTSIPKRSDATIRSRPRSMATPRLRSAGC